MKQESRIRQMMRWVGPAAIVGGTFAVISDQVGLVVHLPEMGHDTMGYHAVGSGLFLLVVTLLFVGMLGLYARRPDPRDAKVIEYGDATARYVLVEEGEHPGQAAPLRTTRPTNERTARHVLRRTRTAVR